MKFHELACGFMSLYAILFCVSEKLTRISQCLFLPSDNAHISFEIVTLIFIQIESHGHSHIGGDEVGGTPLKSKVVHISPVSIFSYF